MHKKKFENKICWCLWRQKKGYTARQNREGLPVLLAQGFHFYNFIILWETQVFALPVQVLKLVFSSLVIFVMDGLW
jgi:hypothetical protein